MAYITKTISASGQHEGSSLVMGAGGVLGNFQTLPTPGVDKGQLSPLPRFLQTGVMDGRLDDYNYYSN
jgi:hypothetical protein